MKILPRPQDSWSRTSFRMVLEVGLVFIVFFFLIRIVEDMEDAYINGYWGILRAYEETGRVLILCLAMTLVPWSACFLIPSVGRRERGYRYGLVGLLVASVCFIVYSLGLNAKPR